MLEKIYSPKDLQKLNNSELRLLCTEMRERITQVVSHNGGHLASNLGLVEATVALHRVFDFSKDSLIFDVGHQSYAHKLLTGRREAFDSIRKMGGISGFTNRFESEYDTLTAGHSGPSVSAGLGIAKANKLCGNDNYVVSVVGDGSFTNGMIYEALNNCYDKDLRFIIVLNDNEMSISSNVGNLAAYFSKLRTSKKYFKFKRKIKYGFMKIPRVGVRLVKFFGGVKNTFKRAVLVNDGFFGSLGVKYFGPVDGHDIKKLEDVFEEAKSTEDCCIVVIKTKKGKGYEKAEANPESYHSVGKFEPCDGIVKDSSRETFSDVFGRIMVEKASRDDKLCTLTAAMCEGTGLLEFSEKYPDRFFDVGIAEEHEITFASGLAAGGLKPVCAVYSTFSQRVYDQAMHDVSIQKLPLVLALDRSGFVPDDGITHQGIFDVSLFSSIPDCTIYSPETYEEMEYAFDMATADKCLSSVRYPKGSMTEYDRSAFEYSLDKTFSAAGQNGAEIVIFTYGRITYEAYKAYRKLSEKHSVRLVKLVRIYPLDKEVILRFAKDARCVYILEEGIKSGGIGEKIASVLCGKTQAKVVIRAVDNSYAFHATSDELIHHFGMDCESVVKEIEESFS